MASKSSLSLEGLDNICVHYARTLKEWRHRFNHSLDKVSENTRVLIRNRFWFEFRFQSLFFLFFLVVVRIASLKPPLKTKLAPYVKYSLNIGIISFLQGLVFICFVVRVETGYIQFSTFFAGGQGTQSGKLRSVSRKAGQK